MANVGALDQVRTFLREHPDVHNQLHYACGTTGCIAGWAIALNAGAKYGQKIDWLVYEDRVPRRGSPDPTIDGPAQRLLGLTPREADALFYETLEADEPEAEALNLIDAIIAREKDDLTDEQRGLLDSCCIPVEP